MEQFLPDKCKSSAFTCVSVSGNINITHFAASLKYTPQIFWGRAVREIIHFQGHHSIYTGRWSPVTHFGSCTFALQFNIEKYCFHSISQTKSTKKPTGIKHEQVMNQIWRRISSFHGDRNKCTGCLKDCGGDVSLMLLFVKYFSF